MAPTRGFVTLTTTPENGDRAPNHRLKNGKPGRTAGLSDSENKTPLER
jgi:hypothetical protein